MFWYTEAQRAFRWYLGGNDLSLFVFDVLSGGCYDGLHMDRLNRNEGAESTLAFQTALSEMREADKSIILEGANAGPLAGPDLAGFNAAAVAVNRGES